MPRKKLLYPLLCGAALLAAFSACKSAPETKDGPSEGVTMNTRVPAVPLITCDPYFSVWSPADHLYDADTVHWTGRQQRIRGLVSVDGVPYRFMGVGSEPVLTQRSLEISATASCYRFEGAGIWLEVTFLSPLLLDDPDLFSRPVSYTGLKAGSTDGKKRKVEIAISFDASHCRDGDEPVPLVSGVHDLEGCFAAWMGQSRQAPVSYSGDDVRINWGYLYLAVPEGKGRVLVSGAGEELSARFNFPELAEEAETYLAAAYDDIASINYFGEIRRGYWARNGKTILTVIEEAIRDYGPVRDRAQAFDQDLSQKALAAGGAPYRRILNLAYRQSTAAHKLIADETGALVFISKECFSNGCAATVDVSYPSTPLYLLYNPELVKGMLRPILRFAQTRVWKFDFAPHDAGRYPHLTGQVYGLKQPRMRDYETYPNFYAYPAGAELYDLRYQMPVEECGNMLIMMAAVAKAEGNADFSKPYLGLLEKWAEYLLEYGADPGEQLCTDDFAGHLAHNCNLAAKAIMGLESFAILLDMAGMEERAKAYHEKAASLAAGWVRDTARGDHSALVFDKAEGWSLKYNLVWDLLFGTELFDPGVFETELQWYIKKQNPYGVPLDSRRDYTKSDWILWIAAFTKDPGLREKFIAPLVTFLEQTPDRVPFSDWYDTVDARHYYFQNRTVQGGLFMPLLVDTWAR